MGKEKWGVKTSQVLSSEVIIPFWFIDRECLKNSVRIVRANEKRNNEFMVNIIRRYLNSFRSHV